MNDARRSTSLAQPVHRACLKHAERVRFHSMSTKAEAVLEGFRSLPREEQYAVYESIARSVVSGDYGPLSDDDLTAVAAQTFALLDEEESRADSR
jgi:hypothetical protein